MVEMFLGSGEAELHVTKDSWYFLIYNTEVIAEAKSKQIREFSEDWHCNMTSNADLDDIYEELRAELTNLPLTFSNLSLLRHADFHCLAAPSIRYGGPQPKLLTPSTRRSDF
nr:unnamed protein product [Spirometra erinaceieuropaei]